MTIESRRHTSRLHGAHLGSIGQETTPEHHYASQLKYFNKGACTDAALKPHMQMDCSSLVRPGNSEENAKGVWKRKKMWHH